MDIYEAAAQSGLDMLDPADWPAIAILSEMLESIIDGQSQD